MQAKSDMLAFVGLMVILALFVLVIVDIFRKPVAPKVKAKAKIPGWVYIYLIIGFAVSLRFGAIRGTAVAVGFVTFLGLLSIARSLLRIYDRDVSKAAKKAKTGDLTGAIADLREAIAAKGPSAKRLVGLGTLIGRNGNWSEAVPLLREAFALDPVLVRPDLAFVLWKAGEPREAEELMAPLIAVPNPTWPHLLHYGRILVDLGRIDEAEKSLDRAEADAARSYTLVPLSTKQLILEEFAIARSRIAAFRVRERGHSTFWGPGKGTFYFLSTLEKVECPLFAPGWRIIKSR